jgi:hypothetical protein
MESEYSVGEKTNPKNRFLTGFAVGVGTTLVTTFVALVAFVYAFNGPQLAINTTVAETVRIDEPFVVGLETSNPHDEAIELSNIDIPNRLFEAFEVLSVSSASEDSPIGGFGSQTWYFDHTVQPGTNRVIELSLRPKQLGTQVIEFDVCNGYEICTMVTRPIEVQGSP